MNDRLAHQVVIVFGVAVMALGAWYKYRLNDPKR
jgi:hypothetical protein